MCIVWHLPFFIPHYVLDVPPYQFRDILHSILQLHCIWLCRQRIIYSIRSKLMDMWVISNTFPLQIRLQRITFCLSNPPPQPWATQHVGSLLPDQASNPCPLHWKRRVLSTGQPGKSLCLSNFILLLVHLRNRILEKGLSDELVNAQQLF